MDDELAQHVSQIGHLAETTIVVVLIGAVAFAVATRLTHLQRRLRGNQGLQSLIAWLPLLQIAVWLIAALACLAVVVRAPVVVAFTLLIPALVAIVIASRDVVRNAAAGAVLAFERSILAGDLITVSTPTADVRGQVIAIGVRQTLLRLTDGNDVLMPNSTLLNSTVRTNRGHELESEVEIELAVEAGFDTAEFPRISEVARAAASVSRFASPHRVPQVFLDAAPDGSYRVKVQAFAFAPDYVRHLRTDVVSLFNEGLAEQPES